LRPKPRGRRPSIAQAFGALEIARSLIERVAVRPGEGGRIAIEIVGDLAGVVEVALTREEEARRQKRRSGMRSVVRGKVVARARYDLNRTIVLYRPGQIHDHLSF
jgi:hypothetical protein